MSKKTAKVDWVFWLNISVRKKWFRRIWKTRGANYMEIQFFIFKISIGLPWLSHTMAYPDYYDEHTYKINMDNLKAPFTLLIKRDA